MRVFTPEPNHTPWALLDIGRNSWFISCQNYARNFITLAPNHRFVAPWATLYKPAVVALGAWAGLVMLLGAQSCWAHAEENACNEVDLAIGEVALIPSLTGLGHIDISYRVTALEDVVWIVANEMLQEFREIPVSEYPALGFS